MHCHQTFPLSGSIPVCSLGLKWSLPKVVSAQGQRLVMKGRGWGKEVTGVLFVCLGNICRSPTAEAVFKSELEKRDLQHMFKVDSCGTGGGNPNWYMEGGWSYHEGDPADHRMKIAAKRRNIRLESRSRPLKPSDVEDYDYLVAMDTSNVEEMKSAIRYWSKKDASLSKGMEKIVMMTAFCKKPDFRKKGKVPDPYYGGEDGFDLVLDLLIDACDGFLEMLNKS